MNWSPTCTGSSGVQFSPWLAQCVRALIGGAACVSRERAKPRFDSLRVHHVEGRRYNEQIHIKYVLYTTRKKLVPTRLHHVPVYVCIMALSRAATETEWVRVASGGCFKYARLRWKYETGRGFRGLRTPLCAATVCMRDGVFVPFFFLSVIAAQCPTAVVRLYVRACTNSTCARLPSVSFDFGPEVVHVENFISGSLGETVEEYRSRCCCRCGLALRRTFLKFKYSNASKMTHAKPEMKSLVYGDPETWCARDVRT